jgi:NTE family protein
VATGASKPRPRKAVKPAPIKLAPINLALQGGGSHGAFTWGVLDALLEDGRLSFDGITGASAGAMNAVVLADGWQAGLSASRDPRESARAALAEFWGAIGRQPSAFALSPAFAGALPQAAAFNPMFAWFDLVSRLWSPYQLNPLDYNPLREVLRAQIDFERLRAERPFHLFICATRVSTGRPRIFHEHELTVDALLASACLPFAFQAVQIDGEPYWDGGYMGNPALWPLFYATQARDLLLVRINPLRRDDLPDTAAEIIERASEVSFNASLFHELRAIDFVQRLLVERRIDEQRYRRVYFHEIGADEQLSPLRASSKYNTAPDFLAQLHGYGRDAARAWLETKFDYVGRSGSVRIDTTYL